jgi:hypothetical protein
MVSFFKSKKQRHDDYKDLYVLVRYYNSFQLNRNNLTLIIPEKRYDKQNTLKPCVKFYDEISPILCKFTSWSGKTPTGNFSDVFLSWTRIMSVLIGWPISNTLTPHGLAQDKNTSLKLPVGVFPLQLVNLHRIGEISS